MQELKTKKSRPWLIAVPLAVFLVIAAAWTVGWFMIKAEVERQVDGWFNAEAAAGRRHSCPQRTVGGFPFRIDITCVAPSFHLQTPEGPVLAKVGRATAAALVYRPEHVVVDLTTPLTVERDGAQVAAIEFQRGQASYRATNNTFERFSLVLGGMAAGRGNGHRPDVTADHVEVHTRHTPSSQVDVRDYDMALTARGLGPAGARPEQGANIETTSTLRGWPVVRQTSSDGPIADWARGGGTFELQGLRVTRGTGLLAASGRMGFNANGRADGQFQAAVADSAALFSGLSVPGIGEPSVLLGPVLALVGRPGEIDGRRGTRLQLNVENGTLSLGAVQVATFPPVF
jgi:hypothetical protein